MAIVNEDDFTATVFHCIDKLFQAASLVKTRIETEIKSTFGSEEIKFSNIVNVANIFEFLTSLFQQGSRIMS